MYCVSCDRTEWDQVSCEMGICSRCYGPLHDPEEDEYEKAEAKAEYLQDR